MLCFSLDFLFFFFFLFDEGKERKVFSLSQLLRSRQNWSQSWPTWGNASTICCYTIFCDLRAHVAVSILLILEDEAFKTHLLILVKLPIIAPQNSIVQ